ncbi:hypothetical protein [Mycobacterium sp. CnD-18-1]|uniref:hypothetical protein n=1 Tax=Mycobacterium sp. CnD-18-1 TaxID=2917744 RepID=UPI001EF2895C|nr:hypothetical protein [Mycobacterium sp. CnD-18-1]MCG7610386.1 hypothetical protein [Mycobacterium sp. CnD-18-1]
MADPVSVVGVVASVVAAVGVAWERWHWLRTRPRAALTLMPAAKDAEKKLLILGPTTPRGRVMVLINWGNERAIGIAVQGMHCKVGPAWPSQPRIETLEARAEEKLAIEVAPEDVERAWILVMWSSPSGRRSRIRMAWFPVLAEGELARVRERQLRWRSLPKRVLLRLAIGPHATPATAAVGSGRAMPPSAAPGGGPSANLPMPMRLRLLLVRRLTEADSPIVLAATAPE